MTRAALKVFSLLGSLTVDQAARKVLGFAVATKGPALGHGEQLDDETLNQIVALGNAAPVRCHLNHPDEPGQVSNDLSRLIGFATNFRRDGDTVRADLQILSPAAAPDGSRLLALADEAPELFGASMVFTGRAEKGAVRIAQLFAVDFVDVPAANPTGLFSAGGTAQENERMEKLKAYAGDDGEMRVKIGETEYALELPESKKEPRTDEVAAEAAEGESGEKTKDEPRAECTGKLSAAQLVEQGRAQERKYAAEFNTAVEAAKLPAEDEREFRAAFYGRELKEVKFFASRVKARNTQPVGESGGAEAQAEQNKPSQEEADAVKRFGADDASGRALRSQFGAAFEMKGSEAYKAAEKKFIAGVTGLQFGKIAK